MSTNAADKMPATEAEASGVNKKMKLVITLEMEEPNPAVKKGVGEGDLETALATIETTASTTSTSDDDPASEAGDTEDNNADDASEQDQDDEEQSAEDEDEDEPYTPQRHPGRISFKDLTIAFQTTKAINMPPWFSTVEGDDLPMPLEGEYRYGPTEDYRSSTLIYFVDDCEMTYSYAWLLYSMLFDDHIVTVETLRRRHLRALYRLEQRYGAKPYDQIGPLGRNVLLRGRR